MNIKEKILDIPFSYPDSMPQGEHPLIESYQNSCKIGFNRALTPCAEVAQAHVNELELAERYNFEAMEEASAGLEQQLLAERAKVDALIAEIDLLKITEYEISVHPWMESAYELGEVRSILDKYRSAK